MRPLALLCAVAFASLALSGCASSSTMTALDAYADMTREAQAWAPDAIFLGMGGFELTNGTELAEAQEALKDEDTDLQLTADTAPLDGRVGIWGAGYFSQEKGGIAVFVADANGVRLLEESTGMDAAGGDEFPADMLREAFDAWTVDSPAAAAALRASNTTLDAISGEASVSYNLDIMDGVWRISGQAGDVSFHGEVDYATAEVTELEIGPMVLPGLPGVPRVPQPLGAPPAPIHETGDTTAAFDPLNLAGERPCSSPSADCSEYPFTANRTVQVHATLTWGTPSNDYDLYITDASGAIVLMSASNPGVTTEAIADELPPGDYMLVVVPWAVAADSFTVDAVFA